MSDEMTYDYSAIDECVRAMRKEAEAILDRVSTQETLTRTALAGWEGTSAGAYDETCTTLKRELEASSKWVEELKLKLQTGAGDMQQLDRTFAGKIRG